MLDVSKKRWQQKNRANFDAKAHREKECSEKWPSLDQKPDGKENVHSHDLVVEHGRPMCSITSVTQQDESNYLPLQAVHLVIVLPRFICFGIFRCSLFCKVNVCNPDRNVDGEGVQGHVAEADDLLSVLGLPMEPIERQVVVEVSRRVVGWPLIARKLCVVCLAMEVCPCLLQISNVVDTIPCLSVEDMHGSHDQVDPEDGPKKFVAVYVNFE